MANTSKIYLCLLAFIGSRSCASAEQGLLNAHLKIVAVPWVPFLEWKCPEEPDSAWSDAWESERNCKNNNDRLYKGILWELLMFMQKARKFTFEFVSIDDAWWGGSCYDGDNCTGIVGRVNRKEADFGLGKSNLNHLFDIYFSIPTSNSV